MGTMNNIHTDFPANMKDGRVYSNWQPTAVINEQLRQNANIQTNWNDSRVGTFSCIRSNI